MLDRDIPPEEEGNTNGAGDDVRPSEAQVPLAALWAATVNNIRGSTLPRWITATGRTWAVATMAAGAALAVGLDHPMHLWNLNRCLARRNTPRPGYSPLSKTCSSWPRFRRPGEK